MTIIIGGNFIVLQAYNLLKDNYDGVDGDCDRSELWCSDNIEDDQKKEYSPPNGEVV